MIDIQIQGNDGAASRGQSSCDSLTAKQPTVGYDKKAKLMTNLQISLRKLIDIFQNENSGNGPSAAMNELGIDDPEKLETMRQLLL